MKKLLLSMSLLASSMAFAADELHLYNWNNYLTEATAKRFEQSCKCKLVQDYYGDNEEMLAKLAAGAKGYDIVVPTGFAVQTLIGQKGAAPLDKANTYSVPYAFTTTVLGYNETQLQKAGVLDKANSWALIFDPAVVSKIKGKVTVLDSQRELMAAALMYLGYPANETDPAKWKQAQQVILKAKPYWAAFNNQSYIKELTVGNAWVSLGYSNDLFQAQQDALKAKRPFKLNFSLQQEGNTLSMDNLVILKDAPRKDLAHKFINFMLDGKNAAELTNEVGAGNPNQAAMPNVKPEITKLSAIFPSKEALPKLQQLQDLNGKQRRELNKLWSEIKLK